MARVRIWSVAVVAGALLIAAALVVLQREPARVAAPASPGVPQVAGSTSPDRRADAPLTTSEVRPRPAPESPRGVQPEFLSPDQTLPPPWPESVLRADEYQLSKMDIFFASQAQSQDWTIEDYARKAARREQLSGREAYEVYTYLRACMNQPRSVEAMQRRRERFESSDRIPADQLEAVTANLRKSFVRCENLPNDRDLAPLMLDWLTLAANRGFPQAQLAYHQSARWLLTLDPWTAYRQPERVHEYRRLAPAFMETAVSAGHPDAFVEYSLALQQRIIFEEDLTAAYGYAVAADLALAGGHPEARNYMEVLEIVLSPDQIREAREMGRRLCRSFCRTP